MASRNGRKPARKCPWCRLRKLKSRGRCQLCLKDIWDQINAGEFTEQEAVDRGLLLPSGKPGRPRLKRRRVTAARR